MTSTVSVTVRRLRDDPKRRLGGLGFEGLSMANRCKHHSLPAVCQHALSLPCLGPMRPLDKDNDCNHFPCLATQTRPALIGYGIAAFAAPEPRAPIRRE
jgi:hypothetical protein